MRKPREIAIEALSAHMTAKVLTGNYAPVLPLTPQAFSVGALLPMILYLFRWGHRRGRGTFKETFSNVKKPTIRSVAEVAAADDRLVGFASPLGRSILGDLLLTSCLENRRHAEGQEEQVQRVYAAHYFASWIDLPESAAHLRGVPEAIVALIADQPSGSVLTSESRRCFYPVGSRVEDNRLLSSLGPATMTHGRNQWDLAADQFDEIGHVAIDQLLTVRLAQMCGQAPLKASGKGEPGPIPNQWPIARRTAKFFREDFLTFFECYGSGEVPRLSLLPMLETGLAIGLSGILLGTVTVLEAWNETGIIPDEGDQTPLPVFLDCSGSTDPALRDMSETSYDLARQRLSGIAPTLMYLRLLDFFVSTEADIERTDIPAPEPYAAEFLNLLGRIANGSHQESRDAEKFFRGKCRALAEAILEEDDSDERIGTLKDEKSGRRHGHRLAEILMSFLSIKGVAKEFTEVLSSALMVNEPNGLALRRRIQRKVSTGQTKSIDVTSLVLSNTALEYLVHRHVRRSGKGRRGRSLSFPEFLRILRERYGFYVDQSPPNMPVASDLLLRNRRVLERRLRDLGLLTGVNDAERMKKLRARFVSPSDTEFTESVS